MGEVKVCYDDQISDVFTFSKNVFKKYMKRNNTKKAKDEVVIEKGYFGECEFREP